MIGSGYMSLSKNLKLRLVASFLNRIAAFSITPFMILYFVQMFGLKVAGVIGIFQVAISYASNLIGGYLGDRYSPDKLIFRGQIIQGLTQLFIGLSIFYFENKIITLSLYLLNLGISNLYKSTFSSLLIASVTSENKKRAYMYDYVSVNIALSLGIAIGSLLFGKYQYLVFIFSSLLIFIIAFMLRTFFDFSDIEKHEAIKYTSFKNEIIQFVSDYRIPVKDSRFVKYVLANSVIMASPLAIEGLGQIHFKDFVDQSNFLFFHFSNGVKLFGAVQIENVIVVVLGTVLLSTIISKLSTIPATLLLVAYVISYNVIYNITSIPMIFAIMMIASISELVYASFVQSMQADLVPKNHRSKYISFNMLGNYTSQLIVSLSLIILAQSNMILTTFILSTLSIVGILVIIGIKANLVNTQLVNLTRKVE